MEEWNSSITCPAKEVPMMTPKIHDEKSLDSFESIAVPPIRSTLAAAGVAAGRGGESIRRGESPERRQSARPRKSSPKAFRMKKSINLWAFPYPQRMSLEECMQLAKEAGFDGIELNYDLDNELSPKSSANQYRAIRKMAEEIGIAISGLCSFLYWPYSLTDNDPARRKRGLELARLIIEAAHELGTENVLTIAGSTYIPWIPEREPVPIDVCDRRARESIGQLVPLAEKHGVFLNIENIVFNGYLTTPGEMNAFVDPSAASTYRCISTPATSCSSSSPNTGFRSWAAGSRTSISRSSPRRGRTIPWSRFGRCWTERPTGRRSWMRSNKPATRDT